MDKVSLVTEQLMAHLYALKDNYEKSNKPNNDDEFFNYVKAKTDPIFNLLDKWEEIVLEHIQQGNVTLHPKQIDATNDNIRALILHSYYIDVRKRRYMEIYKSCEYILSLLIEETEAWSNS